ncbi:hypothetical protein Tco_0199542, partial [Tanacetum coccineum]
MGTPTLVCVWSCPNFSAPAGRPFRCVKSKVYDLVSCAMNDIVASRVSTTDGDESDENSSSVEMLRFNVDFKESMRLRVTEPFEDPIDTETPESPFTVAPPTSLPESTPPTLVPILCRTARMAMRVSPVMLSGLSASMAEVAAMSGFAFCKRFRSSYESLPSSSLPNLPSRKHYRGTSELVEDHKDDDDEEDDEIKESLDSDSVREDVKDEGPTAEDEDPTAGDKGLVAGDEGLGIGVESCGSDDESHGLDDEGHRTTVSAPLGLGYETLRHRELALEENHVYSTFEVGQGSGSAPDPKRLERVSASRQPTLTTWTDPEDGMVYIDVPAYLPPASPVQTPP